MEAARRGVWSLLLSTAPKPRQRLPGATAQAERGEETHHAATQTQRVQAVEAVMRTRDVRRSTVDAACRTSSGI
jgi:hypothetical protein